MPHVNQSFFTTIAVAVNLTALLGWGKWRVMGLTEVRPKKYDR